MSSADGIKAEIKRIVAKYKLFHPEEYKLVKQAVHMKRKLLRDPKYATLEANPDHRALFEISERLQELFIMELSEGGTEWFHSKEGARWFARTFREFCIPEVI